MIFFNLLFFVLIELRAVLFNRYATNLLAENLAKLTPESFGTGLFWHFW